MMREKYIVTRVQKGIETAIGLRYNHKGSSVTCGGPQIFQDIILEVLGVFDIERGKKSKQAVIEGQNATKARWLLVHVPNRRWQACLEKLRSRGFTLRKVRRFRRLMG